MTCSRGLWPLVILTVLLALAGSASAEDGASPTQLDRWWNAVWALGLFGIVLAVLTRFAWKPVIRALNDREKSVRETIDDANRRRSEAQELLEEYTLKLDRAGDDAARLLAKAKKQADADREKVLADAQAAAERMTEQARAEIAEAREAAVAELHEATASLAAQLAGKVIDREINADDHVRLIRQGLEQMNQQRN